MCRWGSSSFPKSKNCLMLFKETCWAKLLYHQYIWKWSFSKYYLQLSYLKNNNLCTKLASWQTSNSKSNLWLLICQRLAALLSLDLFSMTDSGDVYKSLKWQEEWGESQTAASSVYSSLSLTPVQNKNHDAAQVWDPNCGWALSAETHGMTGIYNLRNSINTIKCN